MALYVLLYTQAKICSETNYYKRENRQVVRAQATFQKLFVCHFRTRSLGGELVGNFFAFLSSYSYMVSHVGEDKFNFLTCLTFKKVL